jgi:hypothetical protein
MSGLCASGFVEVSGDNYMVSETPEYKLRRLNKQPKLTKEEFLIEWVLLRASFRTDFNGTSAVEAAAEAWDRIQKLKDK